MVDKEKMIMAKVIARIDNPTEPQECNFEDFYKSYRGPKLLMQRKWREFEIACNSMKEKVRLSTHHTQEIYEYMKRKLNSGPLNGDKYHHQDLRTACSEIEDYPKQILDRFFASIRSF